MSGWQTFYHRLEHERRTLAELGAVAQQMTRALVAGAPEQIESLDRKLEGRRLLHADAHAARTALQQQGFGQRNLREVCLYAPPALRPKLLGIAREIEQRVESLRITVENNKALIFAGMTRIKKIVGVLHDAGTETTGTYKRRGTVPPADGSVLVSRRA